MDSSDKTSENGRSVTPSDKVKVGSRITSSEEVVTGNNAKTSDKVKVEKSAAQSVKFEDVNCENPSDEVASEEDFDPWNARSSEEVITAGSSESFLNNIYSSRQSSLYSVELPERDGSQNSREDPFHIRRLGSTWSEQIEFEAMEKSITEDKKIIDPSLILGELQHAIGHSIAKLPISLGRELLMTDFAAVDVVNFGNVEKGEHDFVFYNYAPIAFWFFRELFGISNETFKESLCDQPLCKVKECGGSGSIFYKTYDDRFILKTVQGSEVVFLKKLLPGYYLNFTQRAKTFLPKYYGMFCYRKRPRSVRIVVMNNLLPSKIDIQRVYDLKGSTFKRRDNTKSDGKTMKDLDFRDHYPNGFYLKKKLYKVIMTSLEKDCHVLSSYEIMDYSLLLGVQQCSQCFLKSHDTASCSSRSRSFARAERTERSFSTRKKDDMIENLIGPFEARNSMGEVVFLYFGIIDILQSYGRLKKIEHCLKSLFYGSTAISVQEPEFYSQRFQDFIRECVLKYIPNLRSRRYNKKRVTIYKGSLEEFN